MQVRDEQRINVASLRKQIIQRGLPVAARVNEKGLVPVQQQGGIRLSYGKLDVAQLRRAGGIGAARGQSQHQRRGQRAAAQGTGRAARQHHRDQRQRGACQHGRRCHAQRCARQLGQQRHQPQQQPSQQGSGPAQRLPREGNGGKQQRYGAQGREHRACQRHNEQVNQHAVERELVKVCRCGQQHAHLRGE